MLVCLRPRTTLSYINDRNEWTKLTSVVMIESERIEDGKTSIQTRYYISSLPNDARVLLASVRTHWGIENSVHWVLDVAFGEDDSRVRQGQCSTELIRAASHGAEHAQA